MNLTDAQREMQDFQNRRSLVLKARINREWYPQETPPPVPEPDWSSNQWDKVQQLRAMVNHLQNKVIELQKKRPLKEYGVSYEL